MSNKKISESTWNRASYFSKEYRIEGQGVEVAILKRKGILCSAATGEIKCEKIDLVSTGDFNKTITVKNKTDGNEFGSMDIKWYGNNNGVFLHSSGKEYIWKCVDFFRGQWAWFDEENKAILTFLPENLFNKSGTIKIDCDNNSEDISLLCVLGLHLKLFFNYWIIFVVLIIIWILKE